MSKLDSLVERLEEIRADIKHVDRERIRCEQALAELRYEEREVKRKIEREAGLL